MVLPLQKSIGWHFYHLIPFIAEFLHPYELQNETHEDDASKYLHNFLSFVYVQFDRSLLFYSSWLLKLKRSENKWPKASWKTRNVRFFLRKKLSIYLSTHPKELHLIEHL